MQEVSGEISGRMAKGSLVVLQEQTCSVEPDEVYQLEFVKSICYSLIWDKSSRKEGEWKLQ